MPDLLCPSVSQRVEKKGAPLKILTTEGIGFIDATTVFKNAPHPNAAILFARWAAMQRGSKGLRRGGQGAGAPRS